MGAVGAMQLVPTTARWIAQESGNPYGDLKDPAINIPLGAWYLRYLINKYHGNLELALAATMPAVAMWIPGYGKRTGRMILMI